MLKIIVKHKFLVLVIITFFFLRLPSLFEPFWYGDEGIYLTLGQGIKKGLILYSQIHDNKPPTLYYFAALSQTVLGFRLLLSLIMIPTLISFYLLTKKFLSIKSSKIALFLFLILTSIPLVEGNIANAEVFMLLPTILAFYLCITNFNWTKLLLSGLLLGLAFTIKVPVVFEFIFLFCWLFFTQIKTKKIKTTLINLSSFSIGFLIPFILYAIYFYRLGIIKVFLQSAFLQNFGYISSWATGTHSGSVGQGGLVSRLIILIFFIAAIWFLKIKKIINTHLSFILFWFAVTTFSALLSARPYPHYLIQVLPPLCLLIASSFSLWKYTALFIFFLIIVNFKFYFYPVFSYYQNFYNYTLRLKNQPNYYSYFGSQVNKTYQIAQFIKSNSSSNQKIFIWGDEPYIYALSQRLPTTKYTVAYHIVDFNGYSKTVDQIKAYLPKFVVYYSMPDRSFPQLDHLLQRYYFITNSIDNTLIYQLRQ